MQGIKYAYKYRSLKQLVLCLSGIRSELLTLCNGVFSFSSYCWGYTGCYTCSKVTDTVEREKMYHAEKFTEKCVLAQLQSCSELC